VTNAIFRAHFTLLTALACSLFLSPRPAAAEIHYTVSLANPEQHLLHVTMEVPDVQGELKLQMPAWNALYEIRDFSSHVQQVEAYSGNQHVNIEKLDKLTWDVRASGTITIHYATFWDDPGPFDTQLNEEHSFINPAMILLYVPDRRSEKCVLTLTDVPADWKVASASLIRQEQPPSARQFHFEAPSYDALADAPIEASRFEEFTIHDMTPPIHVVIHGDGWKRRDVEESLRKLCQYEIKLMDGAPYPSYTFLLHVGKAALGGGGGMEHANSSAIYVPSGAFLDNVSAHEFFHLWNVKRIRPSTLEPVDFTSEMYTRALWFAEGVTNTYASYAMVRTGLWNKQEFYQDLSAQISELEVRPAEHWQSAEQSSLDAWLEKYALYNQPQRSVSYYTKGQVLGVLLDIEIRDRTDNQHSLDDVLRSMNTDFARAGKFYHDGQDVRLAAEKITGTPLDNFFSRYVSGAEPLPYREYLSRVGLELRTRESVKALLGFTAQRDPNGPWIVQSVDADSNASKAGLRTGDEIVRWNSAEPPRRPQQWSSQHKPGDEVHLVIRRGELEKTQMIDFRLGEIREKYFQVAEEPNAAERATHLREGLLRGTTDPITARNP
jgi:predicted metalloprotease with PDZ domain